MPIKDPQKRREYQRKWEKQDSLKNPDKYNSKMRKWRKANPEKTKAINKRQREKVKADPNKLALRAAKQKAYNKANASRIAATASSYRSRPEIKKRIREQRKLWQEKNKKEISIKKKTYNQSPEGKAKNQKSSKIWRSKPENRAKRAAAQQKREAFKKFAVLRSTDFKKIEEMHIRASKINTRLGLKRGDPDFRVLDHKIPLCNHGAHHQDNLRIITNKRNGEKGGTYDPKKYPCQLNGVWANNEAAKEFKKKHNIK